MSTEVYDAQRRLRERWDTNATPRWYTRWDESGAVVESREFNPDESADADAEVLVRTRETNRATLLARLETNETNLRAVATAASFNNTQRDDALRLLARNALAQNKAILGIVGRLTALDTAD